MSEILLQELNNLEIDWLLNVGQIETIQSGAALDSTESFYILLDGALAVHFPVQSASGDSAEEFMQLSIGEIAGKIPFLNNLSSAIVTAKTRSQVLKVPYSTLSNQLQQDASFAAHFYRACALMLAARLKQLSQRLGCHLALFTQMQLKEVATVFAELQDSDLDWSIAVGTVRSLPTNTILMLSGRPVDEMHILIEGAVSLSLDEQHASIAKAFSTADRESKTEFARLSRGDLIGEMQFVQAHSLAVTATALRSTQVLSIPRWRLAAKLLHDVEFAARFYRVLVVLLANKQQAVMQRCGYKVGATELDTQHLGKVALAEARFEWMLKRIQTQIGSDF